MRTSRSLLMLLALLAAGLLSASAASADTWPMFHRDARHAGVSTQTAISSANASTLGVNGRSTRGRSHAPRRWSRTPSS